MQKLVGQIQAVPRLFTGLLSLSEIYFSHFTKSESILDFVCVCCSVYLIEAHLAWQIANLLVLIFPGGFELLLLSCLNSVLVSIFDRNNKIREPSPIKFAFLGI